jgi:ribosome-associated protein
MNRNTPAIADTTPSKSQRKREARELFDLGRTLVELEPALLQRIPLQGALLEAIDSARGIRSNVARKRQLQFVAKLLRKTDAAPIRAALDAVRMAAKQQIVRHHRVEAWRDRLLERGDSSVSELVVSFPDANPQVLRQLVRNAHREAKLNKPAAAARKLFRLLREWDDMEPLPPPPA